METVMTAFIDEFDLTSKWPKKWHMIAFRGAVCFIFFLLGLPMVTGGGLFLLNLVDTYVSGFPLLFVGLFELIAIMFFYRSSTHTGKKAHLFGFMNFQDDLKYMLGKDSLSQHPIFKYFFLACWTVIAPLMLFAIIVAVGIQYEQPTLGTYAYPDWSVAIGFMIVMFPIICVPIGMVYSLYAQKEWGWKLFQTANQPGKTWGPREAVHYQERYTTWPAWLTEKNNGIAMVDKGSTSAETDGIVNKAFEAETTLDGSMHL